MKNERVLAYGLIALGAVLLLTRLGRVDWLWLALLGALFLYGYRTRKSYGFLVAGGVLMGTAVGTFIGTESGMLLGLAVGFFAIDRAEPRPNRWALYAAGIFGILGGLGALSATGILGSAGFALLLIAAGVYFLRRDRQEPPTPQATSYTPPVPAPSQPSPQPTQPTTHTTTQPTTPPPTVQVSSVRQSPESAPSVAAADPSPPEPVPAAPELSPEAEARLRRLEAWRKETASAEGTPAYLVFNNDTLAKIAATQPQTLGELAAIKGVGPVKLERYGATVLALLNDF